MSEKLEPCPLCGSTPKLFLSRDGEVTWVKCSQCGREGRVKLTDEEAISDWNRRPTPSKDDKALVEELARKLCWWILSYSGTEYVEEKRVDDEWYCWQAEARAILPIFAAHREAAYQRGAEERQAVIVAWLRDYEAPGVGIESVDAHIAAIADDLADGIEANAHMEKR